MKSSPKWIQQDSITDLYTFLAAIDWTEYWLVSIIIFHCSCFILIILTRQYSNFQYGLFFSLLLLAYFAERINTVAAENWRLFASEQYFDSGGLFISVILSLPVLLNCVVLIVIWLHTAINLVIRTKRAQLLQQSKDESDSTPKPSNSHESKKLQ